MKIKLQPIKKLYLKNIKKLYLKNNNKFNYLIVKKYVNLQNYILNNKYKYKKLKFIMISQINYIYRKNN